MLINLQ